MKRLSYHKITLFVLATGLFFSSCHKEEAEIIKTDLAVISTIEVSGSVVGSELILTISASNHGPNAATGVVVNYSLPSGYTLISSTPSVGTWEDPKWTIGGLKNGKTETLQIYAKVNSKGANANSAIISGVETDPKPDNNISKQTQVIADEVNQFIWGALSQAYLWNDLVPNLSATKYATEDSLNLFLNNYTDPQLLFTSLLYQYDKIDKWSFLVDNAQTLDDWISGTSKTMGYDFMLAQIGSSSSLFGFVRYVLKGSPAEAAGIKRGDIFMKVDNIQLTISNYEALLINSENYKLGFAKISGNLIEMTDNTATLTAVVLQENPILLDTTFVVNNQKIGYLVYNGFNADFDLQLNDVFKKFRDTNINQLVLDLRYNGGGSVRSSTYLASMIYGTDVSKVFSKSQYNNNLQTYYVKTYGATALEDNFVQNIDATETTPSASINTVNLKSVYIIVSDNTASASEMLINGLRPYMDVKVVGINTYGKYVASMTIKDEDNDGNEISKWAMQPIIAKYSNSLGVTDFVDGLTPTIKAEEDIANLLPFGDPNETLLKVVLDDINGVPTTSMVLKSAQIKLKKVADSHDFKPFVNDMYINPKLKHQE